MPYILQHHVVLVRYRSLHDLYIFADVNAAVVYNEVRLVHVDVQSSYQFEF